MGSRSQSGIALLIHGFGMYGGLYREGLERLVGPAWEAVCLDLPGHGSSPGRFDDEAIAEFVESTAQQLALADPSRVILLSESLGCSILGPLATALESCGIRPAAQIALSPPYQFDPFTLVAWLAAPLVPFLAPGILINRLSTRQQMGQLIGDPEARRLILRDPLVKTHVTLSYLKESASLLRQLSSSLQQLRSPTLFVQGSEDPMAGGRNLEHCVAQCGADICDRLVIAGGRHCLFWDPHTDEFLDRTQSWLRDRVGLDKVGLS